MFNETSYHDGLGLGDLGIMTRMGAHHQPRPVRLTHTPGVDIVCAPGYQLFNGACVPGADPGPGGDPGSNPCYPLPAGTCIDAQPRPTRPGVTPYPGFGQPGTNAPPGSPLPLPPVTSLGPSAAYIQKYTRMFGKPPILPGKYTGAFTTDWTGSPGGPGIPDTTTPSKWVYGDQGPLLQGLGCSCSGGNGGGGSSLSQLLGIALVGTAVWLIVKKR